MRKLFGELESARCPSSRRDELLGLPLNRINAAPEGFEMVADAVLATNAVLLGVAFGKRALCETAETRV
jgi:hypothetical protein